MKVLCDEHVPPAVVNALRSEGVDTATVADALEPGTADADLLAYCVDHGYVLLTNDSDFVGRSGHRGVLYYDDQGAGPRDLVRAVRTIADLLEYDHLADRTFFVPDGWA